MCTRSYKKVIAFLLVIVFHLSINAQVIYSSGEFCFQLNENTMTAIVTKKFKNETAYSSKNVVIPATINYSGKQFKIIGLDKWAFENCTQLETIILPDELENIGTGAFGNCVMLKNITFPLCAVNIGANVFYGCTSLSQIFYKKGHIGWEEQQNHIDQKNTELLKAEVVFVNGPTYNGETFECDGIMYRTIDATNACVEIIRGAKPYSGNLSIPVSFTKSAIEFSVSGIAPDVFCDCTELQTIHFAGTKVRWNKLDIGENNDILKIVPIFYDYYNDTFTTNNYLYWDYDKCYPNYRMQLKLNLKNNETVTGFQFKMKFPAGISLSVDGNANPMISYCEERINPLSHDIFKTTKTPDDGYFILCASSSNAVIDCNDGTIIILNINVDKGDESGECSVEFSDITVSHENGKVDRVSRLTLPLEITDDASIALGDANGDTRVSVGDFSAIASHIMGVTPEGFIAKAADVNSDNRVSVGDLSAVVSMIMNGGAASAKVRSANTVAQENSIFAHAVSAAPGDEVDLVINLNNSDAVTAMQFDMCLPEGMSIVENGTSLSAVRASHTNTFDYGMMADNKFRVLAASTTNALIDGNDGEIVRIRVRIDESVSDGEYPVIIRNAEVADNAGRSFLCADKSSLISVSGNVTGIDELSSGTSAVYYDLNGISDTKMHNGINIIRSADGTMKKVNKKQF